MKQHIKIMIFINVFLFVCVAGAWAEGASAPVIPPAKVAENHHFPPSGALRDRIFDPPPELVSYLANLDTDFVVPGKPYYTAYSPTESEKKFMGDIIDNLPAKLRDTVAPRFMGIYFIENLAGSGWADWTVSSADGTNYFYIVLNPIVLRMNASDWISWKEKSAFRVDEKGWDISIDIRYDLPGFYYILIHEMCHVFDYVKRVTPLEPQMETAKAYEELVSAGQLPADVLPFMNGMWAKFKTPAAAYDFEGRSGISFYGFNGAPGIEISKAAGYYARLEKSPFVTLYGSTNWMEDFAEYAAAYISKNYFDAPWTLMVTKDGAAVYEMKDIFARAGAEKRIEFMHELFD